MKRVSPDIWRGLIAASIFAFVFVAERINRKQHVSVFADPDKWTTNTWPGPTNALSFEVGTLQPGQTWTSPPISVDLKNPNKLNIALEHGTVYLPDLDYTIHDVVEIWTHHEPHCDLIRFRQNGVTNEFHAWYARWEIVLQPITNK